ncbi:MULTISPECIES: hypothetical protein [Bacteroides]|nr:hypothetical protein [Bacteroides graminisolvens]MDD3210908.1 hypothetical protein [Bacteroides graminisolvens]MDD4417934.1 hypothetical protein [Bacteroides graminisolvens]
MKEKNRSITALTCDGMESPDKIWDDVQYRVDDNTATNNISF